MSENYDLKKIDRVDGDKRAAREFTVALLGMPYEYPNSIAQFNSMHGFKDRRADVETLLKLAGKPDDETDCTNIILFDAYCEEGAFFTEDRQFFVVTVPGKRGDDYITHNPTLKLVMTLANEIALQHADRDIGYCVDVAASDFGSPFWDVRLAVIKTDVLPFMKPGGHVYFATKGNHCYFTEDDMAALKEAIATERWGHNVRLNPMSKQALPHRAAPGHEGALPASMGAAAKRQRSPAAASPGEVEVKRRPVDNSTAGPQYLIQNGDAYLRKILFDSGDFRLFWKKHREDVRFRRVNGGDALYTGGYEDDPYGGLTIFPTGEERGKLVDSFHNDGDIQLYVRLTEATTDFLRDEFELELTAQEQLDVLTHAPPGIALGVTKVEAPFCDA